MNLIRKATMLGGRKQTANSRSTPSFPTALENTSLESLKPEARASDKQTDENIIRLDSETPSGENSSTDPWKPDSKELPIVAKMRKAEERTTRTSIVNGSPKSRASTTESKNVKTSAVESKSPSVDKLGTRVVVPLKKDDNEVLTLNSTAGLERTTARSYKGSKEGLGSNEVIRSSKSREGLGSKDGMSDSRSREGLAVLSRPEFAVASLEATEKALREQIAILTQENQNVKEVMNEERKTVEQALKSRDLLLEKLAKVEAELSMDMSVDYNQQAINDVKTKQEKSATHTKHTIEHRSNDKRIKSLTLQLQEANERITALEKLNQELAQNSTSEPQLCSICKTGLSKSLLQSLLESNSTTTDTVPSELAQKMRLIDTSASFNFSATTHTENATNKFEFTEVASQLAKSLNELSSFFRASSSTSLSEKAALIQSSEQDVAMSKTRLNEAAAVNGGEEGLKLDMTGMDGLGESKIGRIDDSAVSEAVTPDYVGGLSI